MKKKFAALILAMAMSLSLLAGCSSAEGVQSFVYDGEEITIGYRYTELAFLSGLSGEYTLYDASDLSWEILEARDGDVVVERVIGIVTDAKAGDGEILNAYDPDANYIGYHDLSASGEVSDGSIVVSYMVYNPETNYTDDIEERYDFVLS